MKPREITGALLAFGLGGCAPLEVHSPADAPEYMTAKRTPFFEYGPMQPGAPVILEDQSFVRLLRKEYGYSKVELSDGRSGYVASEDVRPAPPAARAVSGEELFPEAYAALVLPQPDLTLPVQDIPASAAAKSTHARR